MDCATAADVAASSRVELARKRRRRSPTLARRSVRPRLTGPPLTVSDEGQAYQTFSYEYQGGGDTNAHVTWAVGGTPTWRVNAAAFAPDAEVDVGQRLISVEPMSIVRHIGDNGADASEHQLGAVQRIPDDRVGEDPLPGDHAR